MTQAVTRPREVTVKLLAIVFAMVEISIPLGLLSQHRIFMGLCAFGDHYSLDTKYISEGFLSTRNFVRTFVTDSIVTVDHPVFSVTGGELTGKVLG